MATQQTDKQNLERTETFEEFMAKKAKLQPTCKHKWYTVYCQWTDEPTGQRCEYCWKQTSAPVGG